MDQKLTPPRVVRAVVAMALLLSAPWATPSARADSPAPDKATARYEIRFLTGMIDHHMMAIMMAETCEERADSPELIALCQSIAATQQEEVETMQTWLEDWYGIVYEPEAKMTGQMRRLMSLSGAAFEIEFMRMMIRHHWGAIREGEHCIRRAYHQELLEMCEDIVATQTEEIRLMQGWLCDWYGICNYGPKV